MQYIRRFIKTLSKDIVTDIQDRSESEYYILDGGFKIRLSNHIQPVVSNHGSINVNVVSIFDKPDFIVQYGGSLNLMTMTRKDVKDYIKICYTNWRLDKNTETAKEKWQRHNNEEQVKKCMSLIREDIPWRDDCEKNYIMNSIKKYPALYMANGWTKLNDSLYENIKAYKKLESYKQRIIKLYYEKGLINFTDILRLISRGILCTKNKTGTENIIHMYLSEAKKS